MQSTSSWKTENVNVTLHGERKFSDVVDNVDIEKLYCNVLEAEREVQREIWLLKNDQRDDNSAGFEDGGKEPWHKKCQHLDFSSVEPV